MSESISRDRSHLASSTHRNSHQIPLFCRSLSSQQENAEFVTQRSHSLVQEIERLARELSEGSRLGNRSTLTCTVLDSLRNLMQSTTLLTM